MMTLSLQKEVVREFDYLVLLIILTPRSIAGILFALYSPPTFMYNPTPLFNIWILLIGIGSTVLLNTAQKFQAGQDSFVSPCNDTDKYQDACDITIGNPLFRTSEDRLASYFLGP